MYGYRHSNKNHQPKLSVQYLKSVFPYLKTHHRNRETNRTSGVAGLAVVTGEAETPHILVGDVSRCNL